LRAAPQAIRPMPVVTDRDIGRTPMQWRAKKVNYARPDLVKSIRTQFWVLPRTPETCQNLRILSSTTMWPPLRTVWRHWVRLAEAPIVVRCRLRLRTGADLHQPRGSLPRRELGRRPHRGRSAPQHQDRGGRSGSSATLEPYKAGPVSPQKIY